MLPASPGFAVYVFHPALHQALAVLLRRIALMSAQQVLGSPSSWIGKAEGHDENWLCQLILKK